MSVTTYAGCACCGQSGSGSGSGDGGSGSGSGGGRYRVCGDCFGVDRPLGTAPANLTVTYIDQGGVTATLPEAGFGGCGEEYIVDAPATAYFAGMFAQTALCGCGTGATAAVQFGGCSTESFTPLEIVSCNPLILYGPTPFGTVVITEDGTSPSYPSLGSTPPGCDGISGTLDVTTSGAACLPGSFQIVRVPPGTPVACNYWSGSGGAPGCSCDDNSFVLTCTGSDPGTWVATFAGVTLTISGQTASPFSLTCTAPADIVCGTTIPAGTTFVVTEP